MSEVNIQSQPEVANVRSALTSQLEADKEKAKDTEGNKNKKDLAASDRVLTALDKFVKEATKDLKVSDAGALTIRGSVQHDSLDLTIRLTASRIERTDFSDKPETKSTTSTSTQQTPVK